MIRSAQPELLELAKAMRGDEWATELGPALVACHNAGWDWNRTLLATARLLADEKATPHDLTVAARLPFERTTGSPPTPEFHAARQALGES